MCEEDDRKESLEKTADPPNQKIEPNEKCIPLPASNVAPVATKWSPRTRMLFAIVKEENRKDN
jgi:hypothetical protein